MCGRYSLISPVESVVRLFGLDCRPNLPPRYNIAPNQEVPVVRDRGGGRTLDYMRWGLVPPWAKDAAIGQRMINARAETVMEKPSFRNAFKLRRCLIPADGFYEWKKEGKSKVPQYIRLKSGEPFGFAGLWETWSAPSGERIQSCTIITTKPNGLIAEIHNRMPVILPRNVEAQWLDPDIEDPQKVLPLLSPYPEDEIEAYAVSTVVNSPRNDVATCVEPAE